MDPIKIDILSRMSIPTFYAKKLREYLQKLGLKVDEEVFDGYKHIDLSIDAAKLDIEVDGVQHLTDSQQIITDFNRSKFSREDGYETIHVHNRDLKSDIGAIASAIAEVSAIREEDLSEMANIK